MNVSFALSKQNSQLPFVVPLKFVFFFFPLRCKCICCEPETFPPRQAFSCICQLCICRVEGGGGGGRGGGGACETFGCCCKRADSSRNLLDISSLPTRELLEVATQPLALRIVFASPQQRIQPGRANLSRRHGELRGFSKVALKKMWRLPMEGETLH